jgi:alpha-mannosidase
MTSDAFEQFRALVETDEELTQELWPIVPPEQFVALVVRLAAERGYEFDALAVWKAWNAGTQAWLETWNP